MTYMLGAVALGPAKMDGWDRKNSARRVPILNDGSSDLDEVLQEGNRPARDATLAGLLWDYDDVLTLQSYQDTRETVDFVDPITGETTPCRVLEVTVKRKFPTLWEYTVEIVETAAASSSG